MRNEIEAKLQQVMNNHLASVVLDPVLPIAWPEREFSPPSDLRWIRVQELPAPTVPYGVGDTNDYSGIFQVDVFWPRARTMIQPSEVVGQITRHFKPRTKLIGEGLTVTITRAQRAPPVVDNAQVIIPVSIYYRSFADPA